MISPTSKQIKDWYKIVSGYPCVITGRNDIEVHHPVGRSYKKDKIHIGEIFCYPLSFDLHRNPNHPFSVTDHRKTFVREYGLERDLFLNLVEKIKADGNDISIYEIFINKIGEIER